LLRIEDIDPPREQPGAARLILEALERYGFEWDGPVSWQSASRAAHAAAIESLNRAGYVYPCGCSRRDLEDEPGGPLGSIYPGTCRNGCDARDVALRVRTANDPLTFDDRLQGRQRQRLESESGDFVILRRDGLVAYQIAVVVDDHLQGITDVVRGIDLLPSTPRQIWLQRLLGYPSPCYAHIPVAVNIEGRKLSKSTGAAGLPLDTPGEVLVSALQALRQRPPADLQHSALHDIWDWAIKHWQIDTLRGETRIALAESKNGLW
jgi:glutamyl-Q tRNA(Asp) synthetase